MIEDAGKTRIAVGVFDDADRLCASVAQLIAQEFVLGQFGIIALASTVRRLSFASGTGVGALGEGWRPFTVLMQNAEELPLDRVLSGGIVATRGFAGNLLDLPGDVGAAPGVRPRKLPSSMRGELVAQVRGGAIGLAIAAATSGQLWLAARVLLEHSAYPILTHEFTQDRV